MLQECSCPPCIPCSISVRDRLIYQPLQRSCIQLQVRHCPATRVFSSPTCLLSGPEMDFIPTQDIRQVDTAPSTSAHARHADLKSKTFRAFFISLEAIYRKSLACLKLDSFSSQTIYVHVNKTKGAVFMDGWCEGTVE